MLIARDVLEFEEHPNCAPQSRWCLEKPSLVSSAAGNIIGALYNVVEAVKLKRKSVASPFVATEVDGSATEAPSKATEASCKATEAPCVATESPDNASKLRRKQMYYLRLKRREKANMMVLSNTEKNRCAKAMLEPVMEQLSLLSTVNFWRELKRWEKIVQNNLHHGDAEAEGHEKLSSSSDFSDEEPKSDPVSGGDVEGLFDVDVPFDVSDPSVGYPRYLTYVLLSQLCLPDMEISKRSQAINEAESGPEPTVDRYKEARLQPKLEIITEPNIWMEMKMEMEASDKVDMEPTVKTVPIPGTKVELKTSDKSWPRLSSLNTMST